MRHATPTATEVLAARGTLVSNIWSGTSRQPVFAISLGLRDHARMPSLAQNCSEHQCALDVYRCGVELGYDNIQIYLASVAWHYCILDLASFTPCSREWSECIHYMRISQPWYPVQSFTRYVAMTEGMVVVKATVCRSWLLHLHLVISGNSNTSAATKMT